MDGTCSLVALQHKVWIFNAGKILLDYDLSSRRAVQEYFRARSICHWEDFNRVLVFWIGHLTDGNPEGVCKYTSIRYSTGCDCDLMPFGSSGTN